MSKLKVAMICGSYPPDRDGVGDYTSILVDGLNKSGIEVIFLTSKKKNLNESEHLIFSNWNFWTIVRTLILLKNRGIKLIHIQYPSNFGRKISINLIPIFVRLFLPSLKVLFTIHEYSSFSSLGKIRILLSIIFSQRIIIPEKKNIIEIAKLSPSLKKRITYIPIGSNIRPKEGKSFYSLTDEIIIGYFGIIRPKKGIENLLESFIYLNDERINLLIIGEIDERNRYHKKIKKLIDDYGLIERVKITGYCNEDEVRYHLLRTDLMVLPFPEGVSERRGTFLAAVTHGVPVITTKSNTIPEGLKDGENIKLIEPGISKVLAEAIMELIRNDELRRSIGLNGLKWSQRFTWQKILESHISIYFSLIKN